VDCALRVVRLVAGDPASPIEFRARAHYLAGNLEFLRRDYKAAVKEYDTALRLMPGVPEDAGDGIGRDAAYNRAIALRRIEDDENKKKDAEPPDASNDGGEPDSGDQPDSGKDQDQDGGSKNDKKNDDKKDKDQDQQKDAGSDASAPKPETQPDAGSEQQKPKPQPPQQSANQDDRMLDMLEHAPTMQEQDAKNRAIQGRTRSGMEDK
ncbi:MAG TPA: tetratricopeptide repeat protein, partial [Polyangiaceae bacterium]|nr:tetratricopeptide repeat protein [Polyangiaceae bacterium]